MKGVHVFLMIAAFFGLVIALIAMGGKRRYDWEPSFSHNSDEPFGCELFDRMVSRSMGSRYHVERSQTLRELSKHQYDGPQGWLFVDYQLRFSPSEASILLDLARRGDCVLVGSIEFGSPLCDSLGGIDIIGYPYTKPDKMEWAMGASNERTTFVWKGDQRSDSFLVHHVLSERTLSLNHDSLPYHVLAVREEMEQDTVAVSFPVGKGEVILISTPLIMTNYGMLSGRGSEYIFRLLSRFGDKPVHRVRLNTLSKTREEDMLAMLEYIKTQPPLWWAWCLLILLILLFMLTNARRRQRAIPVVSPPQNHTLEFVRLIGTLYSQQGNHADLLEKKFRYTAERLRRELHVDITDPQGDHLSAAVIARNNQATPAEVAALITEVRQLLASHASISGSQLLHYVNSLNGLLPTTIQ